MNRLSAACLAMLILVVAPAVSAQSVAQLPAAARPLLSPSLLTATRQDPGVPARGRRDSLWNGTLIGLGAGIGAAAALDAVFCEAEGGRCDFPWAAYLTLGGVGAAAGAGIDFLIGRDRGPDAGRTTLRVAPVVSRQRKGVAASVAF